MSELLRLAEAAKLVGVSYPTLKQWIYKGKIRSVKTAGGHHRIPREEVERLTGGTTTTTKQRRAPQPKPVSLNAISGRNKLRGHVTEVRREGLLVQVLVDVCGQTITSIITSDAADSLGLKKGVVVYVLIKATEVMVIRG
jgi:molybdopterin-binding protein